MALRADDVDISRDRALVQRFQAGDDDAFDELYRRYHDRLERFCLKRLGDHHAAEEVAQEAFTRALTALPDLGGEQRFYPWVSVIAGRLCVDHFRRQARSEPCPDPIPVTVAANQEDTLVDAIDASLAVAALARLAPRHQDVLHLREVEGWSYQRIADHYGVTLGTVETLLFRARRALRREFRVVDGPALAAIPLFGRLVYLAARARHRMPSWVPATPSGATLAAAATATAAAVVFTVAPGRAPAKPPAVPPAQVALAPRGPGPVLVGAGQPSPALRALVGDPAASPLPTTVIASPPATDDVAPAIVALVPSPAPTEAIDTPSTTTTVPGPPSTAGNGIVGPALTHAAATVTPIALPDPATVNSVVPPIPLPPLPSVDVGTLPLPVSPSSLLGHLLPH